MVVARCLPNPSSMLAMFDTFSALFNHYAPLSAEIAQVIDTASQLIEVPRGYVLQRSGRRGRSFFLLVRGLAHLHFELDGKSITNQFFLEGDVAADMATLYSGQPSYYTLTTLEEASVSVLDYALVERLYQRYPSLERAGRLIAIQCFLEENERNRCFQTLPAHDRFVLLLQRQPELLQRVSLGHIASYLGMSRMQLSRVRANL